MIGRRILYTLLLVGVFCFCVAYQKWLAWFLFYALLALPVFSLAASLPAMLTARFRLALPRTARLGQPLELKLRCKCPLPLPAWRCKLLVERPLTGQSWRSRELDSLPTEHCGTVTVTVRGAGIYDYLGLARLPIRLEARTYRTVVRPVPVPVADLPGLESALSRAWKPKPGGGFAENHELRLYRPGDNIQQIHWKLSAKTGSLILREPMEPVRGRVLLRMDLKGDPQRLDLLLGQLLWLGQQLLERDVHFQLQCLTGNGIDLWHIGSHAELDRVLDGLLSHPPATSGSLRDKPEQAHWQYFIGGDLHEA